MKIRKKVRHLPDCGENGEGPPCAPGCPVSSKGKNRCKAESPPVNSVEGLKWERDFLRQLRDQLEHHEIPCDLSPGSERRHMIRNILNVCALPERHKINADLLLAAQLLLAYNDRVARAVLHEVCERDYMDYIRRAKES